MAGIADIMAGGTIYQRVEFLTAKDASPWDFPGPVNEGLAAYPAVFR
jgi:hypothetical protein